MFKNIMQIFLLGVLVLNLMVQSGCLALAAGAAVGAGTVIWTKGKLQQDLDQNLERVYRATKAALNQMDLPILVDRKDDLTAKLESEFADGKRIWIDLDYISKYNTKIGIRVGPLGDEIRSREILQKTQENMKK